MGTKRLDCLGQLSRHNVMVAVFCKGCQHFAELDPAPLMMRFGWGAAPEDIPWRCSECGAGRSRILVGRHARLAIPYK
ncbi:hypothetical protein ACJ41P_10745 [Azospirillum argentinense]|uniref:Uncharacterized protein n=1 Tax=Azospirillum argentinense TaxID=2970906 RepID=A0ABW8V523_9PROT